MKKSKFKIAIIILILAFVVLLFNARKDKNWVADYSENENIKTYSLLITNNKNEDINKQFKSLALNEKMYLRILNIDKTNEEKSNIDIDNNKIPYIIMVDNGRPKNVISLERYNELENNLKEYLDEELDKDYFD
ncbi:hypothetical protein JNO63_02620 [Anaerococcus sp. mt242]|uniref:hypothetical protein n=1 Tax=Anaerococcus sp. mt242 TaxID=2661917 RepID=UPI00193218C1|nr:hypothetical protein [Anaerococcus sp. mt242]MBM0045977.1 hypothetical protein [Anaerococcus sp. mt242]